MISSKEKVSLHWRCHSELVSESLLRDYYKYSTSFHFLPGRDSSTDTRSFLDSRNARIIADTGSTRKTVRTNVTTRFALSFGRKAMKTDIKPNQIKKYNATSPIMFCFLKDI